eukprot:3135221-Alexandrium_andersonii.AAC.1
MGDAAGPSGRAWLEAHAAGSLLAEATTRAATRTSAAVAPTPARASAERAPVGTLPPPPPPAEPIPGVVPPPPGPFTGPP